MVRAFVINTSPKAWIKIPIGYVVHDAPGSTHQHHTGAEYQQVFKRWVALSGNHQRP
jgi:hypothetical protein